MARKPQILPDLSAPVAPQPGSPNVDDRVQRSAPKRSASGKPEQWAPLGKNGIMYAMTDGELYFRVPTDKNARKTAPLSATGGNQTIANSGGLVSIPNLEGARVNLTVTVPVDRSNTALAQEADRRQSAYRASKQAMKAGGGF